MPSFCYIAPINYLHLIPEKSKTHLVLAHLVDQSPIYATFYKEKSERGDFIIMDNSAYELKEPYSPDKLTALARQCGATAAVLPDYPFHEGSKTIAAAKQYIPLFKGAGLKTMFVPQSKTNDINDWIDCYIWASENELIDIIGLSILAIPNALPHCHPGYARVVMTQKLIDNNIFNYEKHHHYLGLTSGPALEIPTLINLNALTTVDSSNPIWYGLNYVRYSDDTDSFLPIKKQSDMSVDFFCDYLPQTVPIIEHNVNLTESLFKENH